MTSTQATIAVDLGEFRMGSTLLGAPISDSDPYYAALIKTDVFQSSGQGVEIGAEKGLLDYGFFRLDSFISGSFTRSGQPLNIDKATTESDTESTSHGLRSVLAYQPQRHETPAP